MIHQKNQQPMPIRPKQQSSTPVPAVHPMDGSQFHTVIDEQVWSEQAATPEEQAPRRVRGLPEPEPAKTHPEDPSLSVGDA